MKRSISPLQYVSYFSTFLSSTHPPRIYPLLLTSPSLCVPGWISPNAQTKQRLRSWRQWRATGLSWAEIKCLCKEKRNDHHHMTGRPQSHVYKLPEQCSRILLVYSTHRFTCNCQIIPIGKKTEL